MEALCLLANYRGLVVTKIDQFRNEVRVVDVLASRDVSDASTVVSALEEMRARPEALLERFYGLVVAAKAGTRPVGVAAAGGSAGVGGGWRNSLGQPQDPEMMG